jgi:hypothetical protein
VNAGALLRQLNQVAEPSARLANSWQDGTPLISQAQIPSLAIVLLALRNSRALFSVNRMFPPPISRSCTRKDEVNSASQDFGPIYFLAERGLNLFVALRAFGAGGAEKKLKL